MRGAAGLALLALAAGCAGAQRPPQPSGPDRGAILARVTIKGRELPNLRSHRAEQVYWARLNSRDELDLDHPIETTVARAGDVYVLDLPPGRYAPFAAAYSGLRIRFLARLDNELRKAMTVEVKSGELVFAGEALVRTEWEGFTTALEHVGLRMLALLPPFRRSNIDIATASPRVERAPEIEAAALKRSRGALKGTLWMERVEDRLLELGNPADPVMLGRLRKKAQAAERADRFSYVDTLGWGKPEKIDGGLQWREPKERARVAVTFIPFSSTRTLEGQLEKLRLAGSAEDDHVLYEVRVGSIPAKAAHFTTYAYGKDALVGENERVHVSEALIVGQRDGYYLLLYRAKKDAFQRFRKDFVEFLSRLKFVAARDPEDAKRSE